MKGCVQLSSILGWEDFALSEDRTRSARSVGQRLTHWATGAPASMYGKAKTACLTLLHSEQPKLYRVLAVLSATALI